MKHLCLLLFLATQSVVCQDSKELTPLEKTDDLSFLLKTLKNNYPYFSAYEQTYGKPWFAESEAFLQAAYRSRNNEEYLALVDSVVKSLHNKEADLAPTYYRELFRTQYGEACLSNPGYIPWVNTLNQPEKEIGCRDGLSPDKRIIHTEKNPDATCRDSILPELKTGILRISSFDMKNFREESQRINDFLYAVSRYDYLIIDIQGNKGGNSFYWMKGIVNRLICEPVYFRRYFALKKGSHNHAFFSRYLSDKYPSRNPSAFSSLPGAFREETFKIVEETTPLYPLLPVPFRGEIIILTDAAVFSAADELAYFAKHTNWAIVAGETTGGGGIGSDPALIRLPYSGIIVRYPVLAGLDPDGRLHNEQKTIPSIQLTGTNPQERLCRLIRLIRNQRLHL